MENTVSVDKAVAARLSIAGKRFEVLIDPEKALDLKRGKEIEVSEILAYPAIYKDVRSTEQVSEKDLQKFFGTTDISKVAKRIILAGEIQLTTEQRRRMIEQKKNQIASIISKRGIDPQTNSPHPVQRILSAMEKCGLSIDPFVEAEAQVEKVLKEIKSILPIKFQRVTIQIKIPSQYAGKSYSLLKGFGTVVSEQWLSDGSLQVSLSILAGTQDEFFQKISSLTHGNFESKIVKREDF